MGTRSNAEQQNGVQVVQDTPEDEESDYTSDSDPTAQESEKEVRVKAEEYDDCAVKEQGKAWVLKSAIASLDFFEHRVQQVILFLIPMHNLKEVIINVSLTVFFICMYKM